MLQENDKITVHMIDRPRLREIKTRGYGQVLTVTKHPKTGKLCIDWGRFLAPSDPLSKDLIPLTGFAWTVVFENVETGKLYHYNTLADSVIELAPEYDDLRRACAAGIA